jgi:hypothetical protein
LSKTVLLVKRIQRSVTVFLCQVTWVADLMPVIDTDFLFTVFGSGNRQEFWWPECFKIVNTVFPDRVFRHFDDLDAVFAIPAEGVICELCFTWFVLTGQRRAGIGQDQACDDNYQGLSVHLYISKLHTPCSLQVFIVLRICSNELSERLYLGKHINRQSGMI